MYQNDFIPAVFQVQFQSDAPMTPEEWEEMIGSLMGVYARRISEKEGTFIGHIKGLAELSDTAFIKFSCVNALTGVHHEYTGGQEASRQVKMIINSLVSGISAEESRKCLNLSWLLVEKDYSQVVMRVTEAFTEEASGHHHHDDGEACPICHDHHGHGHEHHHHKH
ncbi:hypothetical protein [Eubacterium sp. 1001713B170207_170306_E7]|uniref:hypothetical protein n=1 Tax=Eubacterium sp. 1001713B170207_170306_E7 TaxID=2787097 RepID=UPI00189AC394|nr:hypothetical protein [Eubacterium sp. 1001713B170207_170306_E7]